MRVQTARAATADLLPLRAALGGALGFALANGAQAQAPAATPAPADTAVRLQPIPVEGAAAGGYQTLVPTLPKLSRPLLDTPQSINVVPRQLIEDQGITATRDALRTVPGISLAAGEAGNQGDNLTLRGFTARNDFFLDGMRDFGSYYRDPFDLEQIEVLKGPGSVLFGRGSTGGVVNQVSKQPGLAPITAGSVGFGTDGTKRLTADINRPIEGLPGAAIRLNLMVNQNGVAGRGQTEYNRFGFAPSISFGLGTPTRFTLSYLHQQEYDTPDYGLPWLYSKMAPVARNTFYGYRDRDFLRANVDMVTAKLEHDFNDSITVRNQFRYGAYSRDLRITEPQINYAGVTPATPLSRLRVTRNVIGIGSNETLLDNQTDATFRFSTGPIGHTLVTGLELSRETSSPTRYNYAGLATTTLLNPNPGDVFRPVTSLRTVVDSTTDTASFYAIDTLKLSEQWEVTAGVRVDRADTDYAQTIAPAARLKRGDTMTSTRFALTYKPLPNGSVYFAYGTSFNPSAESLTLAANTADLAPEKNETFEVGTKWNLLDERLTLNGAVFQIEKLNARVADANNPAFNVLGGDQRVQGFELGATGRITDAWQITAGYAYLDTKVVKTTIASSLGRDLSNTPQHSGSVWTSYALPWYDIQLGAGIQALSERIASSTPNATTGQLLRAPGYVTVQAMAKMPIKPGIDLQVNGFNLTNDRSPDLLHPSHVVPLAGRSVLFSVNFKL